VQSSTPTVSKRTNQELSALAAAIAGGESVSAWAARQTPPIPRRTAYRWSRLPDVRRAVESIRRRCLDRAAGKLARHATAAAETVAGLARSAESEAVKLAAARAVLADLMQVTDYSRLDERLAELERRVHEHDQQLG
jgi:hypothetical protein